MSPRTTTKAKAALALFGGALAVLLVGVGPAAGVTTSSWVEEARVADNVPSDHFGASIAIEGDTAVVGAPDQKVGTNEGQGYVYIYHRNSAGAWALADRITSARSNANESFGQSVGILGNTIVVGAWGVENGSGGAAYVFSRSAQGEWSQVAELTSSDGAFGDNFGFSVAISPAGILVGALGHHSNRGAVYAYELVNGVWTESAQLGPGSGAGEANFGTAISLREDTAVIGAPSFGGSGTPAAGAGYVFRKTSGGDWTKVAELQVSGGTKGEHVGFSTAIVGAEVVLGAPTGNVIFGVPGPGRAYVFRPSGTGYVEQGSLLSSTREGFGYSVAGEGQQIVVGAETQDEGKGVVYVFEETEQGSWRLEEELMPNPRIAHGLFGRSVALSPSFLLIGADSEFGVGHAYVFGHPAS